MGRLWRCPRPSRRQRRGAPCRPAPVYYGSNCGGCCATTAQTTASSSLPAVTRQRRSGRSLRVRSCAGTPKTSIMAFCVRRLRASSAATATVSPRNTASPISPTARTRRTKSTRDGTGNCSATHLGEAAGKSRIRCPYSPKALSDMRRSIAKVENLGSVGVREGDALDADGNLPIFAHVTERERNLIGGAARYSTIDGPGIRAYYANRNLFGGGETLRIDGDFYYLGNDLYAAQRKLAGIDSNGLGGRLSGTFVKPALSP